MILEFKLPINKTYKEFMFLNNQKNKIEGVYKLIFEDNTFYIGQTTNLISRLYNHLALADTNRGNKKEYTKKHLRIIKAINNDEIVKCVLIDNNVNNERYIIKNQILNNLCLNMKI